MKLTQTLLVAFCAASLFTACSSGPTAFPGSVSGTVTHAGGEIITLQQATGSGIIDLASTTVAEDGSFTLTPAKGLALDYYFVSLAKDNRMVILTDSTEALGLVLSGNNLDSAGVSTGSAGTQALMALRGQMQPLIAKRDAAFLSVKDATVAHDARTAAKEVVEATQKELQKVCGTFIREHAKSPASLEALSQLNPARSMKAYETVMSELKTQMGHSVRYKMVETQIAKAQQRAQVQRGGSKPGVGTTAPDITMNGLDGNPLSLSDLRGKVVLVDFWASWCGPCRRENPNVVRAYAEYRDKGFEVFSVSLDSQKDKWEKAIDADALFWPAHVSDLKGWKNAAAQLYDVHSIPATFLIDQEGKVVATDLRGAALDNKLASLLGASS